jgi:hypothetical protein
MLLPFQLSIIDSAASSQRIKALKATRIEVITKKSRIARPAAVARRRLKMKYRSKLRNRTRKAAVAQDPAQDVARDLAPDEARADDAGRGRDQGPPARDESPARAAARECDGETRHRPRRANQVRGKRPANRTIVAALEAAAGVASKAAERLGISSSSLWRWLREDPELAAAHARIEEHWFDLADSQLKAALTAGESWAIRFYLTYKGRKRVSNERVEVTGKDGSPDGAAKTADPLAGLDTTTWTMGDFETYRALIAKAMRETAKG